MKKFIAVLSLLLCVCLCFGAACAESTDADLKAARAYLRTMYKGATESTPPITRWSAWSTSAAWSSPSRGRPITRP